MEKQKRRDYVIWVPFTAPPLTYLSLRSLGFISKMSNREMEALLRSAHKDLYQEWKTDRTRCSCCGGEWMGDNPKGIRTVIGLPREQA